MANKISFEVMVLTKGRWVIHSAYSENERAQAVRDAKALENLSTTTSVKVVREESSAQTGKVQEDNIYASSNLPDDQPQAKQDAIKKDAIKKKAPGATPPAAKTKLKSVSKPNPQKDHNAMQPGKDIPEEMEEYNPDDDSKKSLSIFGIFLRILIIILVSVLLSFAVAASAYGLLNGSSLGVNFQTNIYIGLFIVTFAVSFIAMTSSLLSKAKFLAPEAPALVETSSERKFKSKLHSSKSSDYKQNIENEEFPDEETISDEEPEREIGADISIVDATRVEEHSEFIMRFLVNAMEEAAVDKAKLDNFNRFGINLFIAGACETLAQHHLLDAGSIAKIMIAPITFMGFKSKDAEAFAGKVEGYLLTDSKYMLMYQAGRSALDNVFRDTVDRPMTLKQALEDWNKPKEAKDDPNAPITVMFADIAGSTNMTQTLGDSVAQQVVRTHNRIVRGALKRFSGKEVKHTGDGIMASFTITSNSIEATAKMQMDTLQHNIENPDLPLGLKIGLNTGEAIAEDNDLFGTTVQLAARIVDKAQAGQIFVSETVHGICGGKTFEFVSRGSFDLKGFGGDPTLYELAWNKDAPPEPLAIEDPETGGSATEEPETGDRNLENPIEEETEIGADLKIGNSLGGVHNQGIPKSLEM